MKKIIQILVIIILVVIFGLIIIFVFNPGNLKTKLISNVINSYLENILPDYQAGSINNNYDHPLLNETQETTLKNFGVDVS